MQVRNHIKRSNEKPQSDSHRKIDNKEAYTEQNPHTKGNQCLTAEISVHAVLHIMYEVGCEGTILVGQQMQPSFGYDFIIQQYKDYI